MRIVMALLCKHCGECKIVKAGLSKGKQRYKCKICNKVFSDGDRREKYGIDQKLRALKLYTDGVGLRTIERAEGISTPLLIYWIRKCGRMVKQHLVNSEIPDHAKDIEILEVDDLFTFYQKKPRKFMYGLLWTETGIKLLISQ
jgi:transposase-like protein